MAPPRWWRMVATATVVLLGFVHLENVELGETTQLIFMDLMDASDSGSSMEDKEQMSCLAHIKQQADKRRRNGRLYNVSLGGCALCTPSAKSGMQVKMQRLARSILHPNGSTPSNWRPPVHFSARNISHFPKRGGLWRSPDHSSAYLGVQKAAINTGWKIARAAGYIRVDREVIPGDTITWTLVRDPLERLLSGVDELRNMYTQVYNRIIGRRSNQYSDFVTLVTKLIDSSGRGEMVITPKYCDKEDVDCLKGSHWVRIAIPLPTNAELPKHHSK